VDPLSGRTLRVVGALEDITTRKEAEFEGLPVTQMAEPDRGRKSEFLANLSHELRTPLNAIIGFAEVMEQEMLGPIGQKAYRDYARNIQSSGLHLLAIINDLLDVSKAAAGKLELDQEPISLVKLAEASLLLVQQRAEQAA